MTDQLKRRVVRLRLWVIVGALVLSAGRLLDLRWHATHNEFETGADQLEAHWLAWLGAVVLIVAGTVGSRSWRYRSPGFLSTGVSAWLYAAIAGWHFWLHQQLRDPDLPHVLLALSQLGLYAGSVMVAAGLFIPRCRQKFIVGRMSSAPT